MIGVYKIQQFFKKKQAMSEFNLKTMVLHSSAFGLFLIMNIIGYISYTIFALNPESVKASN